MQSLKTINTEVTSANMLKSIVVNLEGEMVAIEYIKEGLLVGVFGEKMKKKVDMKVDDTRKIDAGKAETGRVNDAGVANGAGDAGETDNYGQANIGGNDMSTKSSPSHSELSESGGDTNDEVESEWHDIKVKAEATAEYLRDELHDFKMPAGLEGLE